MSTLDTPRSWTTSRTAEAVVVPRRHVLVIAILMCVPLPLLSLAATVVPLPQIVEIAAVTFISIAAPVVRTEGTLIRQKAIPVRSVEITHRPAERGSSAVSKPTKRTRSQTAERATPAGAAVSKTVHVDGGGTQGKPAEPSGGAADEPAETGPSTDGEPGPGASTDPPSSSASNSGAGGSGGGGSGSGSGSGGSGSGGGGSGNGADPPGHGGADPGRGNGNADPTARDPGSGSGSPPEPPPTSNRPPDNGHGKR
jgi:uncharacterized membrane protein YgcG